MNNSMSNLQSMTIKDVLDAFTGAKGEAREMFHPRDQILRILGAHADGSSKAGAFGVFAAGLALGAGLAVLFTPRAGSDVREAIGEKVDETLNSLRPTGTAAEV
jgi:hypothetical protein